MITDASSGRTIRSGHESKGEPRWSARSLPFSNQKGSKLLTPYGWCSVLAFAAIAAGAALAFAI